MFSWHSDRHCLSAFTLNADTHVDAYDICMHSLNWGSHSVPQINQNERVLSSAVFSWTLVCFCSCRVVGRLSRRGFLRGFMYVSLWGFPVTLGASDILTKNIVCRSFSCSKWSYSASLVYGMNMHVSMYCVNVEVWGDDIIFNYSPS